MIHRMTQQNVRLVDELIALNRERSNEFHSIDARGARKMYRAKHPTEIVALKCMDGRLNLSVMTQMPIGIIHPFRNIGGEFKLGWPYFGALMRETIDYAMAQGRRTLVLVTYHYSKSHEHLGCRGHNYNTEKGREAARKLCGKFPEIFGSLHQIVYPVLVGIETDADALTFHGSNGHTLDLSLEGTTSEETLRSKLIALYPDMHRDVLNDLFPLVCGNARHSRTIKESGRKIEDADHKEEVLAVGRGFGWLHIPNKALIVGPYSDNIADPIAKAAGILRDNIKEGRVSGDELVLMSSAVYRNRGSVFDLSLAREKAYVLADEALRTIGEKVPEIMSKLKILVGTTNLDTMYYDCAVVSTEEVYRKAT